jgi:hypothetical protein
VAPGFAAMVAGVVLVIARGFRVQVGLLVPASRPVLTRLAMMMRRGVVVEGGLAVVPGSGSHAAVLALGRLA